MQISITFTLPDELPAASEAPVATSATPATPVATFPSKELRLKPEMTFENFVTGESNQVAHAAARRAAENPGVDHNPLYLYGRSGTGKTHLLHAIGNFFRQQDCRARVAYLTTEQFWSDVVRAYQCKAFAEFKRSYHSLDALFISAVEDLSGKPRTQEELLYTVQSLLDAGKQIVLSGDVSLDRMEWLEAKLLSRIASGLVVGIDPPDLALREKIVLQMAATKGIELDADVAHCIAEAVGANCHALVGALKRVMAYSQFLDQPISAELAKKALETGAGQGRG